MQTLELTVGDKIAMTVFDGFPSCLETLIVAMHALRREEKGFHLVT